MRYYFLYLLGKLRSVYFMRTPESWDDLLRSRKFFTVDGISSQSILMLCTGAFLVKLLKYLGVNDTLNGLISSIPALTGLFQIIGAKYAGRLKKSKLFVSSLALTHRLIFASLFFLPLLRTTTANKTILFVILLSLAYMIGQLITPAASNWLMSLTPQNIRGRYLGLREKYMIVISSSITLIAGRMLDFFEFNNLLSMGFMAVGFLILILGIINFTALSMIHEPLINTSDIDTHESEKYGSILKRDNKASKQNNEIHKIKIKEIFANENFRKILNITAMWSISFNIVIIYWGIYLVVDLKLSITYLMFIALMGSLIRMFLAGFWGRIADRTSWANVLKIIFFLLGCIHILLSFVVPKYGFITYAVGSLLAAIPWAGMNFAMFGIQFDFAPHENRSSYIATNGTLAGFSSFTGALIGGLSVYLIQKYGLTIFGTKIYAQQLLMAISGVMIISCSIYVKFVIEKMTKIVNIIDGSVRG